MREDDIRLGEGDKGPGSQQCEGLFWGRRTAGRALLVISLLLIVASLPGRDANAASSGDRAGGAEIFKQKGCEHCHGADGIGTARAPSLTAVGKRLHKDQIEHQIRDGGKQMPRFQDVLDDDQIRQLVDYLAHKKKAPEPQPGG